VPDSSWRELHATAEAGEPALMAVFLAAIGELIRRVRIAELFAGLTYRDAGRALAALHLDTLAPSLAEFTGVLDQVATAQAERTLSRVARTILNDTNATLTLRLGGGLPTHEIADWARAHAGTLAQNLSNETRYALQNIIADALGSGQSPAQMAALIEKVIGLNQRQAGSLARFRAALKAAGTTGDALEKLVARRARLMLRQRARAIARTESITAANAANRLTWERNVREGVLDPSRWRVQWLAVEDDRLCPSCLELDGQTVRIGEPFISPTYGEVDGPALHPACRCSTALVRA
jgi:uncharacterized protein with gpF-like domain